MVATVIVSVLCAHLLCFGVLYLLLSTRLPNRLGLHVFAFGSLVLGAAYVLQLLGGPSGWGLMSLADHTLTVAAPVIYVLGALQFFGRPVPIWRPIIGLALGYTAAQVLVQWLLGPVARHAMVSGVSALIFLAMAGMVVYGIFTFAKDLYIEMTVFAVLIGGLCLLNVVKCALVLTGGLEALGMSSHFQQVFYAYMSLLAIVLAPSIVWLVLRRLTDELRATAARDPLTQLLNRRGLIDGLRQYFGLRSAQPAYLLMLDIDHFKRVNDTHGHLAGDAVLCEVAAVVQRTLRQGDLACRAGGEEFIAVCLGTDDAGARHLAERLRAAVEQHALALDGTQAALRCTVTIGVSNAFTGAGELDRATREADAALYRGKAQGRNQVRQCGVDDGADGVAGCAAAAAPA